MEGTHTETIAFQLPDCTSLEVAANIPMGQVTISHQPSRSYHWTSDMFWQVNPKEITFTATFPLRDDSLTLGWDHPNVRDFRIWIKPVLLVYFTFPHIIFGVSWDVWKKKNRSQTWMKVRSHKYPGQHSKSWFSVNGVVQDYGWSTLKLPFWWNMWGICMRNSLDSRVPYGSIWYHTHSFHRARRQFAPLSLTTGFFLRPGSWWENSAGVVWTASNFKEQLYGPRFIIVFFQFLIVCDTTTWKSCLPEWSNYVWPRMWVQKTCRRKQWLNKHRWTWMNNPWMCFIVPVQAARACFGHKMSQRFWDVVSRLLVVPHEKPIF